MTASRGINLPKKRWTPAEDRVLRERYPDTPGGVLAALFDCRIQQVYSRAANLGLAKSDAFKASPASGRMLPGDTRGMATRIGQARALGIEHRIKPGQRISPRTEFKAGQLPVNTVPIGTVVVASIGYKKVKVSDDRTHHSRFNWRFVHRLVWEEHHGPVPKGHVIAFKNGDKLDTRIENLELVTKVEWINRHRMHKLYPKRITKMIHAKAALTRRINREEKRREEQSRGSQESPVRAAGKAQGRQGTEGRLARGRQVEGRGRRGRPADKPRQGRGRGQARARR